MAFSADEKCPHMNSKKNVSVWECTYIYGARYGQNMYFVYLEKKETEDSYVIEVSTLQFDLHPINVPGIAFAQLEKIGFSG